MEFKLDRLSDYSDKALISELKRVAELVPSGPLTRLVFNEHSRASASTLMKRFGGWQQALEAASLGSRYCGQPVSERMRSQPGKRVTQEQVVEELKKVAEKLGRKDITVEDFDANASFSSATVRSIFKTWSKALSFAELTARATSVRYSDEECFENLLRVWTYHGRVPKYLEMNQKPSEVGGKAYIGRWGGWVKALEAFVERVKRDEPSDPVECATTSPKAEPKVVPPADRSDDGRIRLGIRYRVLVKDCFKCVLCGNSPAADPACRLHVDHIQPHSKGGLTIIENLRTLCGACNIGKSNLTTEGAR